MKTGDELILKVAGEQSGIKKIAVRFSKKTPAQNLSSQAVAHVFSTEPASASWSKTTVTGIRVPETTGFPPQTRGSIVMCLFMLTPVGTALQRVSRFRLSNDIIFPPHVANMERV